MNTLQAINKVLETKKPVKFYNNEAELKFSKKTGDITLLIEGSARMEINVNYCLDKKEIAKLINKDLFSHTLASRTQPNKVLFFEGSFQFKSKETDHYQRRQLTEYLKLTFNKLYRYRPSKEKLWCIVKVDGKEAVRYEYNSTDNSIEVI